MIVSRYVLAFVLTVWHDIPQGHFGRQLGRFENRPAPAKPIGTAVFQFAPCIAVTWPEPEHKG